MNRFVDSALKGTSYGVGIAIGLALGGLLIWAMILLKVG